jgi:hypothetical protein
MECSRRIWFFILFSTPFLFSTTHTHIHTHIYIRIHMRNGDLPTRFAIAEIPGYSWLFIDSDGYLIALASSHWLKRNDEGTRQPPFAGLSPPPIPSDSTEPHLHQELLIPAHLFLFPCTLCLSFESFISFHIPIFNRLSACACAPVSSVCADAVR